MKTNHLKKIKVNLGARSYDVQIGPQAIEKLAKSLPTKTQKKAFVIADEALTAAREKTLSTLKEAGYTVTEFPVQAGEKFKDFANIYPLYGQLLKAQANRDSLLVALGGGTIGDAAGFIAATFLRGISWVGVPTTLLAQVDSAIGGKTGINHELGKNLIGAIHQPSLVICDTNFLSTLSMRDRVSGFAEVVKCALTFDPKFYSYLEKNTEKFLHLDAEVLANSIQQAVSWKAKVVAKDELDRKGHREVLNFGHTFGHSLESISGYGHFRHGEAVIWGMRFAIALSQVRKKLSPVQREKIDAFLRSLHVPTIPKTFDALKIFEGMTLDKKVRDGKINFVLLKKIGQSLSDNKVSKKDLSDAWTLLLKEEVK